MRATIQVSRNFAQLKPDSLAFGLYGAAHAVAQVRDGMALPQALAKVFSEFSATPQTRGLIQDISYRSMRLRGRTDALIAKLTNKPLQQSLLHAILNCALSLIADDASAPYEPFTVVNQAVDAVSVDPRIKFAKGLVNAVLRRFLREKEVLLHALASDPVAVWNYPRWWIKEVQAHYPQHWEQILRQGNLAPPLTLRVNVRTISVENYLNLLAEQNMAATQIGLCAIRLDKPVPVDKLPGFGDGMVSVQDGAAQLAAPLLELQAGMRVLDACAAPGGKTGHILESAEVSLLALDQDAGRLEKVNQNLQRLQLRATVKTGDAAHSDWWDGQPFDRILADVPCTASGIVRRHPDIRWLRRPDDAAQLATLSANILDNLWTMLRPGGKLLLATCSIWPLESHQQAEEFATRQSAIRLDAPGQLLPGTDDFDGLFYALFQKPSV